MVKTKKVQSILMLLIINVVSVCLFDNVLYSQTPDLKCTNNPARSWWDVQHYALDIKVDTGTGSLNGTVRIEATITGEISDSIQIDLQEPLEITDVLFDNGRNAPAAMKVVKRGNIYIIKDDFKNLIQNGTFTLSISYNGIPAIAVKPPWDGGLVMSRDANGLPWIAMACQGIGASVWFPCKDFQGDEADKGMHLSMLIPANLQMISNGRLQPNYERRSDGNLRWTWFVENPINNYDISFYIGDYVHWADTLNGAKGPLDLDYYVLRPNEERARKHFEVVKPMLQCFEEKIGPYPFYEDGYKLVEAPYLGMEHQSAVAYGNGYQMGYKGVDRSKTGVGLLFDFIIVHESGHEWFGNSITAYDKADTWIHEGFTTYTETIFAECLLGKKAAFTYQQGKKNKIRNDGPVQGRFNECNEGSGDHYDKAAFMIHMIRMIMKNDATFFAMLKSMNEKFYHKIISGKRMEDFINAYSGKNFDKVFDQYLRTASLPKLAIRYKKQQVLYKWTNCVAGFNMPVLVYDDEKPVWLKPTTRWQSIKTGGRKINVDENFLIDSE